MMRRRFFVTKASFFAVSAVPTLKALESGLLEQTMSQRSSMGLPKVLVTGAVGHVGTDLCKDLRKDHWLRMLDINSIPLAPNSESLQGSITDWETIERGVQGVDAVVHLAIYPPAKKEPHHQLLQGEIDVDVKGTDLLLYAAKQAGVRRFVYTSTLNVYDANYPNQGEFLKDTDEPLSRSHYGTAKHLAEELCRHYALTQELSTLVLRLNSVTFPERWSASDKDIGHPEVACSRVHINDVVHSIRLALKKEAVQWGRCIISGANPEQRYDTSAAEHLIGFRARYGFAPGKMFRDGLLIDPRHEARAGHTEELSCA
jgi:nucleoside-diphosphate-sugar epimerase